MKWGCRRRARAWSLLLAGAAALAMSQAAVPATAAPASPFSTLMAPRPAPAPPTPPPDDALAPDGFYLESDKLIEDEANHLVVAQGGVEARYQGRVLRADQLEYNTVSGIVTARGNVVLTNPDGTTEFSTAFTADKDFAQAVALGFATRRSDNVKIAAASAIHRPGQINDLNDAIFTPCEVCAKHPTPTWSIRARHVVQDHKRQTLTFRDAVIEVKGVPVFYTPYLSQADPQAPRKSGLLMPIIVINSTRGLSWEQPYVQVISPSQELVISPQINTKVNPFLNLDYRKRFYSGAIDARVGYTDEAELDGEGNRIGPARSRAYVLASGAFQIDRNWLWGFTGERTSDPLIFDKYGVQNVFEERGLYASDDRRLISQLYATRQDRESYFSIAAISVQGLRPADVNSTFPTVAPLIEWRWDPSQAILGGRLRFDADGVVLARNASPVDPTEPGVNSRRGTIEGDWRRTFILPDGIRVDPFVHARADLYSVDGLEAPLSHSALITRGLPSAGLDFNWPFMRRTGDATIVLEPIAQLILAPVLRQDPRIPNEDSVDFTLDQTNLFSIDPAPGFDLIDSGSRLNVGGRATVSWPGNHSASVLLGRSFRSGPDPSLPAISGLRRAGSDWIVSADATPAKGVQLFSRLQLAPDGFALRRVELGGDFVTSRVEGFVRYLQEAQDATGAPVRDLDLKGSVFVTQHWGLTAYLINDFTTGTWRRQELGVVYRDDCVRLEVVYRHDETFNRTLGPTTGIGVRLTLATLGNSGYTQ
ncbi:MAG: LPS-assembly protein LptD [Caulobacterales bacterium]